MSDPKPPHLGLHERVDHVPIVIQIAKMPGRGCCPACAGILELDALPTDNENVFAAAICPYCNTPLALSKAPPLE